MFFVKIGRVIIFFIKIALNPISTEGGGGEVGRFGALCYIFINNFLFTSAFFVKFSDFS